MHRFDGLRTETLSLFGELGDIARTRGATEAAQRLSAGRERFLDEKLVVVVCGEFKRGKSSLLNALLEEPGLFPVDSFYATSLITTAVYAPRESITVSLQTADGGLEQREVSRADIAAYATESGNPGNQKRVQLITIRRPDARLAQGLTLVDTPGVGGPFEEHSAVTLGYLQSASALVFVTDATQPLLDSELDFIRRAAESARVTDDADGIIFAMTKIDAVDDFGPLLGNTTAKIAEVTGRPAGALTIVPVSAQAKLDYLSNGLAEYNELSNMDALEQALWAALTRRRARAVLEAAAADLERAARSLIAPIETEIRALADESRELTGLSVQAKNKAAWLAELRGNKDSWRADLARQLRAVREDVRKRGKEELDEVWGVCETVYLHNDHYMMAPDLLLSQVISDAAAAFGSISELSARSAARALSDFSIQHGLELRKPEYGRIADPPVPLTHVSGELARADRPSPGYQALMRAVAASKKTGPASAGVGAAIGMIVGSAVPGIGNVIGINVGWIAGFVLGSSIGTVAGYRDAVKEARDKGVRLRRDMLWAQLKPLRDAQERYLVDALDELTTEYTAAAVRELESRIAQEHESADEAMKRLTAMQERAEQAAEQRRHELVAEKGPLDRILARIAQLGAATAALHTPEAAARPGDNGRNSAGMAAHAP